LGWQSVLRLQALVLEMQMDLRLVLPMLALALQLSALCWAPMTATTLELQSVLPLLAQWLALMWLGTSD
jgi:hypothetical protein